MGEQRPKSGAHAQVEVREPPRARREGDTDAPEPTFSEARPRLPSPERTNATADADTKVERRASVRPSAFGVPRKSEALASVSTSDVAPAPSSATASLSPHERVLEAARLLDALDPALLEGEASLYTHEVHEPVQRLANQRARGVEHLVERAAVEAREQDPAQVVSKASAPPIPAALPASARPASAALPVAASSTPKMSARLVRRPWLSLLLFGGMIALSVVPLLRYAQSAEDSPARARAEPARSASLSVSSVPQRSPELRSQASVSVATGPATTDSTPAALDREQAIAAALSEGTRALDNGDIGLAERMFGQVIELAEDNAHAAYGLARIRLRQNNLAGAEGWIQSALRKRPRRAAYHQLYAEVLARMGRITEARDEQARAELHE